jgi:type II secretory pathway pseudopilin PulG
MRQRGFSYIGLLLLLAMTSAGLAAAGSLWSIDSRREKEAELLFLGAQFTAAIAAYRDLTPSGQPPRFPQRLDDLLDDKRWPTTRRHLRRVFVDPMTGTQEWGIVAAPGGGIMGVYSLAEGAPLKRDGFPEDFGDFATASSYRDWRFIYAAPRGPEAETN